MFRIFHLDFFQSFTENFSHAFGIFSQIIPKYYFNGFIRGGAADGVPAKGRYGIFYQRICNGTCGDYCCQRQPIGNAFCHGHHVWLHAIMIHSPHFPGAAESSLDFVRNKYAAVVSYNFSYDFKILFRRSDESAYSLDGFNHHSCNFTCGGGTDQFVYIFCTANATLRISAFQRAAITVGRKSMFNCGYLGGQSSPGGMCRKRLGQHGSPGIGMTESNKFYIPREQLRHHNSCFIRLGSRSGKKTFLQISWCNVFQTFS